MFLCIFLYIILFKSIVIIKKIDDFISPCCFVLQAIRQLILYEYNEIKRDPKHREMKRRFHYLHEKLSHIKRLVLEYDTQNCGGMTGNSNADSSNEIKDMNSLHY